MDSSVDEDWLSDEARYYASQLEEIAARVDGEQPVDGSVSGQAYEDARDFINTIEAAAEALYAAHIHVVDADEIDRPRPMRRYRVAHEKLDDVAYRDLPDVPGRWRTVFDDAKADLQDVLSDCPRP